MRVNVALAKDFRARRLSARTDCEYSTALRRWLPGYGSKPDWSAFGGHGASLGDVEVLLRPPDNVVLAVPDRMAAALVRFHPANLHRKRRDPIRLKAWGFPIPIGDSKPIRYRTDSAFGDAIGRAARHSRLLASENL